jgi:hypothetical protein
MLFDNLLHLNLAMILRSADPNADMLVVHMPPLQKKTAIKLKKTAISDPALVSL